MNALNRNEIKKIVKERGGIKLDIGCGNGKHGADWVGMDMQALPGVDIIQDFNKHPWGLPDESVMTAMCTHVIEHIPKVIMSQVDGELVTRFPLIEFFNEVWRIMIPDGQFALVCPHGGSQGFMQDPTHISQIDQYTFAYFDPLAFNGELYQFYRPKPWRIKTLDYSPIGHIEAVLVKRRMDKSYEG